MASRGVVAAGHELTAEAGAEALRAGGNAVDAAVAAMLVSFVAEPLLTGLGAGGYMLVVSPEGEQVLLDFFVEAPGRGADPDAREELVPVDVSFGDAHQIFNIGPASVGAYGVPAGVAEAIRRFGNLALSDLVSEPARLAREGVALSPTQAYIFEILGPIITATPESAEIFAPGGTPLREGERCRNADLADMLELLGREGPAPFYRGSVARSVVDWIGGRGGQLTLEDLAAYEVVPRDPVRARYRGRDMLTNPPPSAGGILIAYALALLERDDQPPSPARLVDVMARVQDARTPEFVAGLAEPDFVDRFMAARLGSTTHISVLDEDGWACGVTCSNGEGAGTVVPGTGIHPNNMMGEHDLNPLGFHQYPPGRRMPSMMAPTVVVREGRPELVLGSGGSNRIRSAIVQTIANVIDHGMPVGEAVRAPRLHFEEGIVYVEPGVDTADIEHGGHAIARFRSPNVFFGGVHAAVRDPGNGSLHGGGDPRRGGSVAVA